MQVDLVLLALGGVQWFIGELRSTADAAASDTIQRLDGLAARAVLHPLAELPALCGGVNRTLPLPPPEDVEDAWNRWIDGDPRLPHDYYGGP